MNDYKSSWASSKSLIELHNWLVLSEELSESAKYEYVFKI